MIDMDMSDIVAFFGETDSDGAPLPITRRRDDGSPKYGANGRATAPEWETSTHEGVVIVPVTGADMARLPAGTKTSETRRVFWPATDGLRAASVSGEYVEDQIQYLGDWWKVQSVETWSVNGEFQDVLVVRTGRG